jgi:hypothetical protein
MTDKAITGGSRGIGLEVAKGLAEAGADVSTPPLKFMAVVDPAAGCYHL